MGCKMDQFNEHQLLKLQPPNITWESNKQQQQQAKIVYKPENFMGHK